MKYIRKISDYAVVGGLGAMIVAGLSGCDSADQQMNQQQQTATNNSFTQAAQKEGAFVVIQEEPAGQYKIVDEYPSETTRVILRGADGSEKILSQEELDKMVKEEAAKIDAGTSNLTSPEMHSGGMSLGETILASAAGAIIGSWIGSKLFNNQNYQQNRRTNYKSPSTYSRSVNSFNKTKTAAPAKSTSSSNAKSGFFGDSKSSPAKSSSFSSGG